MPKPRLIVVIRHAQSEGNKNREIHQTIPDHRVKLTEDGWGQAYEAGKRLKKLLRPDDTLHFFTSPYRRTRETTEGILSTLTADDDDEDGGKPSPFQRPNIKVYEEPRLREQDFGNFQPCSAEMERMWQERADYGHFFYRIPNGESAADAYDRVSGFNESLWRQFEDEDFASVCVLVTHGLMSRVFLMKWYHFSVEYFEDLRNVNHCEFLIMRQEQNTSKYILESKLRTWSELRKERALLKEKKEKKETDQVSSSTPAPGGRGKDSVKMQRAGSMPASRRWGGCPNGCAHGKDFKIRSDLAELVRTSDQLSNNAAKVAAKNMSAETSTLNPIATLPALDTGATTPATTVSPPTPSLASEPEMQSIISRRPAAKRFESFMSDAGQECGEPDDSSEPEDPRQHQVQRPRIDIVRAKEELVSSPDGTPSFISPYHRLGSTKSPPPPNGIVLPTAQIRGFAPLNAGRDFGGTYSGNATPADSSDEDGGGRKKTSPDAGNNSILAQPLPAAVVKQREKVPGEKQSDEQDGVRRRIEACRLGDVPLASDAEADADDEGDDETNRAEKEENTVRGSVY